MFRLWLFPIALIQTIMDPADDYVPAIDDLKPETFHVDNLGAVEGLDDSIETTNPGKAVWLIACTVSMGGFLFGRHAPDR